MVAKKLDYEKVKKLHDQGLKVVEIADKFNVNKATVSRVLKKLNASVAIITATDRAAPAYIADLGMEADHLYDQIKSLQDKLDWLESNISKGETADYRQWFELIIKGIAEIRKLSKEITDTKFKSFKSVQIIELLRMIDEAISNEPIEVQKRIAKRIKRNMGTGIPYKAYR